MIQKSSLKNISEDRKILIRGEDFVYLLPCEQLRGLISNFTISFPNPSMISDAYTVMPHGSVTLVIYHNLAGVHTLLFGPCTKPQRVGDLANKCDVIFIIEFQPAGFYPFTERYQKELTDRIVPFSLIDAAGDRTIRNIFVNALSVDTLVDDLEQELIRNMRRIYPEELSAAVKAIIQMEGVITSEEISNHVFYSTRHLNRLFNLYLGMSMKAFSRLVRINKSIQLLNESKTTLAFVCETLGYYDVSHLVKEFKIVCGITPQEYRTNMSDFYSEVAKF